MAESGKKEGARTGVKAALKSGLYFSQTVQGKAFPYTMTRILTAKPLEFSIGMIPTLPTQHTEGFSKEESEQFLEFLKQPRKPANDGMKAALARYRTVVKNP